MSNKTTKQKSESADVIAGTSLRTDEVTAAIRKRGSKSASIEANNTATPSEISEMIGNVLYWYHKTPVKSDDECADRLTEYFRHVASTGEIPTVEKMCLSLGVARETVWRWKTGQGCSVTRRNMIKKAYDIMGALDAELVSRNKIPQVTYIFRAKNFYDLADQQQIVVTPNDPLAGMDAETARKRYAEALPEDTGTDEP